MVTAQANPALQQALALANQYLRAGDAQGADSALAPIRDRFGDDPRLLHLTGLIRMHQQRFAEASDAFARARAANPREAVLAFSHGTALRWLEHHDQAVDAFRDAFTLKPDYAEAYYEAGTTLQQLGKGEQAEAIFRQWLQAMPGNARGKLALGDLLLALSRPKEAEPLLREALQQPVPEQMAAILHQSLGRALVRQGKDGEALENFDKSAGLAPDLTTDATRAEILQKLKRYEEAAVLSGSLVARDPANPQWHKFHNDLLYRLGRDDYLKSFDRAPRTMELLLSKAYFLAHEKRGEEAHQVYSEALKLDPDNKTAATGLGNMLNLLKRHTEAQTVLDGLLARHGEEPDLLISAAEAAIAAGDAQKAAALCARSVALVPHDQVALAIPGDGLAPYGR